MNKKPKEKLLQKTKNEPSNSDNEGENNFQSLTTQDILKETRLAKVMAFYSKGLNQQEIASELEVSQSTISRDLEDIKKQARNQMDNYFRKDIPLEYTKYLAGSDEIIKELWEVVRFSYDDSKVRLSALKLLLEAYEKRHGRLTTGPEQFLKIKKAISDTDFQDFIDSNPEIKANIQMQKFAPKIKSFPTEMKFLGDLPSS